MTKIEIAEKLKQGRINSGKTQKDVASLVNRSVKLVGHWETGYSQPDADTLSVLLKIYKLDANEFFEIKKTPEKTRELSEEAKDIAYCFMRAGVDGKALLKHVADYIDKANNSLSHQLGGFPEAAEIYSALAAQTYSQQDTPAARQK